MDKAHPKYFKKQVQKGKLLLECAQQL